MGHGNTRMTRDGYGLLLEGPETEYFGKIAGLIYVFYPVDC